MSSPNKRNDAGDRMLASVPDAPALGRGPTPDGSFSRHDYHHPAAGWAAAESVAHVLEKAGDPIDGFRALFVMNHENGGFDCPGARGRTTRAVFVSTSARTGSSTSPGS